MKYVFLILALLVLALIALVRSAAQSGRAAPPPGTRPRDPKPPTEKAP